MASKRRDDFSRQTIEILAKRVTYCCSNPECRKATIGPNVNKNKANKNKCESPLKRARLKIDRLFLIFNKKKRIGSLRM